MFKRAIFQPSRQFSCRSLAAAAPSSSPKLIRPTIRQWQAAPAYSRLRRAYSTETSSEPKAEESKPAESKKENEDATESTEVTALKKELEAKKQEAKDFKDKFQRSVADYRNLIDRTERDKKNARDFAIQKFAKDLVDSVDNLDRALGAVPEQALADAEKNKELVDLYNGLKMTESILLGTLKKHGLEKVDPVGEPFDPNKHEATFQVPMPDKEPNTVFHVQQTGFLLNGRTVRAAKVGVVASPQ